MDPNLGSGTTTVRRRAQRNNVLVAAALVTGLLVGGGGAAVGATLVTSKMIKNDTIKPVDLNFVSGQDASTLTGPLNITTKEQQVLSTSITVDDAGGSAIGQAFVEIRNPTASPVTVSVKLVHEQDPTHASTVTATLDKGQRTSIPVGLLCDGMPAGEQTVQLSVIGGSGLVVESALLSAIASPTI